MMVRPRLKAKCSKCGRPLSKMCLDDSGQTAFEPKLVCRNKSCENYDTKQVVAKQEKKPLTKKIEETESKLIVNFRAKCQKAVKSAEQTYIDMTILFGAIMLDEIGDPIGSEIIKKYNLDKKW